MYRIPGSLTRRVNTRKSTVCRLESWVRVLSTWPGSAHGELQAWDRSLLEKHCGSARWGLSVPTGPGKQGLDRERSPERGNRPE